MATCQSRGSHTFDKCRLPACFPVTCSDYLNDQALWSKCVEPQDVVPWNLTLFSILLVIGGIQMVLCAIQVVNGLLGTLCGDCQCCGCCGVSQDSAVSSQSKGGQVRPPSPRDDGSEHGWLGKSWPLEGSDQLTRTALLTYCVWREQCAQTEADHTPQPHSQLHMEIQNYSVDRRASGSVCQMGMFLATIHHTWPRILTASDEEGQSKAQTVSDTRRERRESSQDDFSKSTIRYQQQKYKKSKQIYR